MICILTHYSKKIRIAVYLVSIFVCSLLLYGCASTYQLLGNTMGTTYSITSDISITALEVDTALKRVNNVFSNWQADSEVNQLNISPLNTAIKVSPEFMQLLTLATTIHTQTLGYFNITLGKLIDIWGFGAKNISHQPTDSDITRLLQDTGHNFIYVSDNSITKLKDIYLNFSAIAKGYAADVIAQLLLQKGSTDFVVEIGGEVRVMGTKQIGIERLDKPPYPIELTNEAIATSGDYRNVRVWGEESFMHILNPFTGKPATSDLVSVSVIAPSAAWADGYATALLAMGKERAVAFVQKNNLKSVLIDHNNILTTYNL